MKLTKEQRVILRKGILGAYPNENELKIILLEEMDLNLEEFNSGETYNTKVFNLITKLEANGNLEDFIKLIVRDKPNSPHLEEIKSEFPQIIEEKEEKVKPQGRYLDKIKSEFPQIIKEEEVKRQGRYALVVSINTHNSLGKPEATADDSKAISQNNRLRQCAKLLETHGKFQVSFQDSTVNQRQLKEDLVKIFKSEDKIIPETALFYFSGYGLTETRGVDQSYLALSDTNPDEDKLGISLEWLRKLLVASPVREQIIWLDCCGENLNFDEANPGQQEGISRYFIAASGNFELTKALQEGLDPSRNPQKEVTNKSLTVYLQEQLQGVKITNFGEAIALTRLASEVQSSPSTPTTDTGICPYKGLRYFDCNEEDPKYFHGRESLTDQLLDKVRQNNFLAIVGPSGSGKSSVMRAGLLHQLKRGEKIAGSGEWKIKIMVPGEHPMQSLARTFVDTNLAPVERATQIGQARELLTRGWEGLELLIEGVDAPRVILVLDQFEEVFTLCENIEKREKFLLCLLETAERLKERLCIVLSMRADFLGKCLERGYNGLGKKIQENTILVSPMNREQLREAIALPAKKVNLKVEKELIDRMLNEIEGSPRSLPLLEYTLTRLWEERGENQLKLSIYENLGGIGGTLNSRATKVYEQFTKEEQEIAKMIFLSLTQLGEGTEDKRRRVNKGELMIEKYPQTGIERVIQKLANEKLIVTNENDVIDVAHEALIRNWQQLREWLEGNRDALGRQRKIEEEAKYWERKERNKEYLWTGTRLEEAVGILKEYEANVSLSALATEFLQASSREELISYLGKPEIDNLDKERIEKEAEKRSYIRKEKLRELIEDEREKTGAGLAASWVLEQWGEEMPMRTAEVDKEGNIRLRIVEKPPLGVKEDLGEGINIEMVEIPGGEFMMGSSEEEGNWWERPRHKVKVPPFMIGKYPVTREEWRVVADLPKVELDLNRNPSFYKGEGVAERVLKSYPVTNVNWYEAVEFCGRLSVWSREKGKGYEYRLPSEAEWEYACRGGKETPYHWGYKMSVNLGNYLERATGRPNPVKRFQVANRFGLYDVHGNVWEWCEDDWHDTYEGAPEEGRAWLRENDNDYQYKVLRGGSWCCYPEDCRSAFRVNNSRDYRYASYGFRVVCEVGRTR